MQTWPLIAVRVCPGPRFFLSIFFSVLNIFNICKTQNEEFGKSVILLFTDIKNIHNKKSNIQPVIEAFFPNRMGHIETGLPKIARPDMAQI